jgi:hypothetical protein
MKPCSLALHCAILIAMIIGLIALAVGLIAIHKPSHKMNSGFAPGRKIPLQYEKELHLFQSMSSSEQVEYLNLSRDNKLVKYGNKLL